MACDSSNEDFEEKTAWPPQEKDSLQSLRKTGHGVTSEDVADDQSLKEFLHSRIEVWNLVRMSTLRMLFPSSYFLTVSHSYHFVDTLS